MNLRLNANDETVYLIYSVSELNREIFETHYGTIAKMNRCNRELQKMGAEYRFYTAMEKYNPDDYRTD